MPVTIHIKNKSPLSGYVVSHDESYIRLNVGGQGIIEISKWNVMEIIRVRDREDVTADYLSAEQVEEIREREREGIKALIVVGCCLASIIFVYLITASIGPLMATCFSAGTKILLADGSSKNIESLEVGDRVLGYNLDTGQTEADEVLELYSTANNNMMRMEFSDGTVIHSTFDHPYYVKSKGWCSLKPDVTNNLITNITDVDQLEEGDVCYLLKDGQLTEVEFVGSERIPTFQRTYTIKRLKKNNTFFAEGVLVGVEAVKEKK